MPHGILNFPLSMKQNEDPTTAGTIHLHLLRLAWLKEARWQSLTTPLHSQFKLWWILRNIFNSSTEIVTDGRADQDEFIIPHPSVCLNPSGIPFVSEIHGRRRLCAGEISPNSGVCDTWLFLSAAKPVLGVVSVWPISTLPIINKTEAITSLVYLEPII